MQGPAAEDFDPVDAKKWTESLTWCKLSILNLGKQQANLETDEVEFAAKYVFNHYVHILQERSQFQKIGEQWFYVSGTLVPHQPILLKPSNPCPCGSRKKFSQCCALKKNK